MTSLLHCPASMLLPIVTGKIFIEWFLAKIKKSQRLNNVRIIISLPILPLYQCKKDFFLILLHLIP